MHIEIIDKLSIELQKIINEGHKRYEFKSGVKCDYKTFYYICKDNSNIAGVLQAYTAYGEIHIEDIFVKKIYRKKGIGKKLIQHLENNFKNKGYNNINLVTSEFQAPIFYKKCGFELEFIRNNKYNPKLNKYFYIKYFDNKTQNRGII